MLRRLLRAPGGEDLRDADDDIVLASYDDLLDELDTRQLALDALKQEIVEAAAFDTRWVALAKAAWPDEVLA